MPTPADLPTAFAAALNNAVAAFNQALALLPAQAATAPVIAAFRIAGRPGWEGRGGNWQLQALVGGKYVTLATSPASPKAGQWTLVKVTPTAAQGWQALPAAGSSGNLKVQALDAQGNVLTGTGFGEPGSYGGQGNTFDKAMSSDLAAFYDAAGASPGPFGQAFAAVAAGPALGPVTQDPKTGFFTAQVAIVK